MLPIHFRNILSADSPAPGELWVQPATEAHRALRATALLVLEHGLDVLDRGAGEIDSLVVNAEGTSPTFDEMLAADLVRRRLAGEELVSGYHAFAEYGKQLRKGFNPLPEAPAEKTIEGLY